VAPSLQALQSEVSLLREHLVEGRREWEGKVAQLERDAQQAALAHQVPPTIHMPSSQWIHWNNRASRCAVEGLSSYPPPGCNVVYVYVCE
jgi:hypothetical protein